MTTLYLASGSPRRQELLTQLGLSFERVIPGIEEQRRPQESAQQYVVRLAREKAQAGVALAPLDLPVLGADTIVILNGEVLEKPRDAGHAAEMLRSRCIRYSGAGWLFCQEDKRQLSRRSGLTAGGDV